MITQQPFCVRVSTSSAFVSTLHRSYQSSLRVTQVSLERRSLIEDRRHRRFDPPSFQDVSFGISFIVWQQAERYLPNTNLFAVHPFSVQPLIPNPLETVERSKSRWRIP